MSKEENFVRVGNQSVHYQVFGSGPKTLLAFHGFADDAGLFRVLDDAGYRVLAIDLPYHGKSIWTGCAYGHAEIIRLIDGLKVKEQFDTYSIVGFSFGGRVVLSLLPKIVHEVDGLFLIAPDGIRSKWVWMRDHTPTFFKKMWFPILKSRKFVWYLSGFLSSLGMPSFYKAFIRHHTSNEYLLRRMICTWVAQKSFPVNPKKIQQLIISTKLSLHIAIGQRDRIIESVHLEAFVSAIPDTRLDVLEGGHRSVFLAVHHWIKAINKE